MRRTKKVTKMLVVLPFVIVLFLSILFRHSDWQRLSSLSTAAVVVDVMTTMNVNKLNQQQQPLSILPTHADNNDTTNTTTSRTDETMIVDPSTTTTTKHKPTLVLHVGPLKTATTSLQAYLYSGRQNNDKRQKKRTKLDKALRKDNYQLVRYNYIKFQKLIATCLAKDGPNDCDWTLWKELIQTYQDASSSSSSSVSSPNMTTTTADATATDAAVIATTRQYYNVIHSTETWSKIPKSNFSKTVVRSLQDRWNVRIVLTYRSVDSWLPSLYAQYRKGLMFLSRSGRWKPYPLTAFNNSRKQQKQEDIMTFPIWFDHVLNDDLRDAHGVKVLFQDLFGPQHVVVLDMYSPNGIETEFMCHGIGGGQQQPPSATPGTAVGVVGATSEAAPHACNHTQRTMMLSKNDDQTKTNSRRRGVVKINTSAQFLIDHDLLIVEAYRQGLISPWNNNKRNVTSSIDRHSATLVLDTKLKEMNMTMENDFPRVCLSKEQMDRLRDRTWLAETQTAPHPRSFDEMTSDLLANQDKFCSVDAPAVLRNATWRNYFSSCAFRQQEEGVRCSS